MCCLAELILVPVMFFLLITFHVIMSLVIPILIVSKQLNVIYWAREMSGKLDLWSYGTTKPYDYDDSTDKVTVFYMRRFTLLPSFPCF